MVILSLIRPLSLPYLSLIWPLSGPYPTLISPLSNPYLTKCRQAGVAPLGSTKWACLDAVLSVAVAAASSRPPAPPLPPLLALMKPTLCRQLLREALDELQHCLESETVVVLRCLRRCWCQIVGAGVEEQVKETLPSAFS